MSLDQIGRRATEDLRGDVTRDLDPALMLVSIRRTRVRRRSALVVPVVAAAVACAALWTSAHTRPAEGPARPEPGPSSVGPLPAPRTNGVLLGYGDPSLNAPSRLHVPPITSSSSPTWSPDGARLAVLAAGILVTDVRTGAAQRLECAACSEIAWSHDGRRFAAVAGDGRDLILVDAEDGDVTDLGLAGFSHVHSLTWSPRSDRIGFVADGGGSTQAAFAVQVAGGRPRIVLTGPLNRNEEVPAHVLSMSWSPTDEGRIAVLIARPPRSGWGGVLHLSALMVRPDGSGMTDLGDVGRCGCDTRSQRLTWSPDGTTLAIDASWRGRKASLDADGEEVTLRLVTGAGPLAWRPR